MLDDAIGVNPGEGLRKERTKEREQEKREDGQMDKQLTSSANTQEEEREERRTSEYVTTREQKMVARGIAVAGTGNINTIAIFLL